ncbi:MAG: TIGR01212 family radical SAM protein [Syntrophaceae bacterium]|nr:TIGR01212 family radical SAM protein [Syntrophaceae bacterium]
MIIQQNSTEKEDAVPKPAFWNNAKRYYDLKSYWINRFGCRIHKLPIDAGFTCPNRDDRVGTGGCIYCDGRGSALRQGGPLPTVAEQIRRGQAYYRRRGKAEKFIAYFQTFTNTYGPVKRLRALYDEALAEQDVVGLSIGTRPDCISDETMGMIRSYAEHSHVWLELGIQSLQERTLRAIRRGHDAAVFYDAVGRAAGGPILICVHIIVGLPGESRTDILETARRLSELPIDGIKIHSLLALEGTELGARYRQGEIGLGSREDYVGMVCDILEMLPSEMVVQRLTADGYREVFLGPDWAGNKLAVLNAIDRELERRDSWQGKRYEREQGRQGTDGRARSVAGYPFAGEEKGGEGL